MASEDGRVCTPPVEPLTTEVPLTVNSLLRVRLPLNVSWLALMPVASPPDETPAVRDNRLRIFRLGSGRLETCEAFMTLPSDDVSVASSDAVSRTSTDSLAAPGC